MRQRVEREIYSCIHTVAVMQYCVQRRYLKRTLYDTSIQSMRCSLNFKNAYYTFERIIVFGFPLKRQYYYNIILLLSPFLIVVTLCRHTHTHTRTAVAFRKQSFRETSSYLHSINSSLMQARHHLQGFGPRPFGIFKSSIYRRK